MTERHKQPVRTHILLSLVSIVPLPFYVSHQLIFWLFALDAVSYQGSERIFSIATNFMISLAFIQLFAIVFYHFLTYTCRCNVVILLQNLKRKLMKLGCKSDNLRFDVALLNIPERTYNYSEYQDGLISDDFK